MTDLARAPGRPIYLDHNATTPCDPRVVEAMLPWFGERFGNPASTTHIYGREAAHAVEAARAEIAALVGADAREIIFTSGATEALNLALKGIAARARGPMHVVASAIEHKAVLDVLHGPGFHATLVAPTRDGVVTAEAVAQALNEPQVEPQVGPQVGPCALVTVMAANNEVGSVQPIADIARLAHDAGALMLCDAVQVAGKLPFDVHAIDVDLAALSAHKLYGPKGIGALVVRRRRGEPPIGLVPQIEGGGHERGLRSGTLNVPAIVGFGVAARLAREALDGEGQRLTALVGRLWAGLEAGLGAAIQRTISADTPRLPGSLHVIVPGLEARRILEYVPELALSSGSACTSAELSASHVLTAMGLTDREAHGALRIGLGRYTSEADVDVAVARLVSACTMLARR